jgi:diguanylate cyclase (GGDEF)-like protein
MTRHIFQQKVATDLAMVAQGVLLWLDIDHFMEINENHGLTVGDRVLQTLAARLQRVAGPSMLVARMADDQFALWQANGGDPLTVADPILRALTPPYRISPDSLTVTVSMGAVQYPTDGTTTEDLLMHALHALSHAKQWPGNMIAPFDAQSHAHKQARFMMGNQIQHAWDQQDFQVFYQPQMAIPQRTLVGMEALTRWTIPGRGMVSPGEFIPIMEHTPLISALGAWVLKTACLQNQQWQAAGLRPTRIAVNVSAYQFADRSLLPAIEDALAASGLAPQWLEIEITESTAMQNLAHSRSLLNHLRQMGIRVVFVVLGVGFY